MVITGYRAEHFRNLKWIELFPDPGVNVIFGENGQGKTNIIESIWMFTGCHSFRTHKHTELIEKNGIRVMDTAGFNLLEAENSLEPDRLKERYPEFVPYEGKCRFRECLHDREPDCAVCNAASAGLISIARLERYRILLSEAREQWRNRYD